VESLETEISNLSDEIKLYGKVLSLYHKLVEVIQENFIHSIEELVTSGIQAVFGEAIKFIIEPSIKGKSVYLDFFIEEHDGQRTGLLDNRGGGLTAVVGVVLRIIMVRLLRGRVRQFVALDESLAMLSADYTEQAGALLKRLSDQLGIQILMVTHQREFLDHADAAYELKREKGKVLVSKI
jgi:DNA repair exonuclease SbcCD ATPase subunit